jgi:hypothetical protein
MNMMMMMMMMMMTSLLGRNFESKSRNIPILHHNVQSLTNKLMELNAFLNTSLLNLYVLCFSLHWLIDKQIKTLNTEQYKLADNFSKV